MFQIDDKVHFHSEAKPKNLIISTDRRSFANAQDDINRVCQQS